MVLGLLKVSYIAATAFPDLLLISKLVCSYLYIYMNNKDKSMVPQSKCFGDGFCLMVADKERAVVLVWPFCNLGFAGGFRNVSK